MSRFQGGWPTALAHFYKAHGLGNDYLVFEEDGRVRPEEAGWVLGPDTVRQVCDRWSGVGSDGIVLLEAGSPPFRLRMFNPDGSEFERSGNGLRVLASWLSATGRVPDSEPFQVEVAGDRISMTVHGRDSDGTYDISVELGRAVTGPDAVALDASALVDGRTLALPGEDPVAVHLVSVGNPHCVVFADELAGAELTLDLLARLGPAIATHGAFRHGTNVQIARVTEASPSAQVVEALIWERGVGHTSASGTSSCAVAVAAVESGRLQPGHVEVRLEGGTLEVIVDDDLTVVLRGPVQAVMTGELEPGFVRSLRSAPGS